MLPSSESSQGNRTADALFLAVSAVGMIAPPFVLDAPLSQAASSASTVALCLKLLNLAPIREHWGVSRTGWKQILGGTCIGGIGGLVAGAAVGVPQLYGALYLTGLAAGTLGSYEGVRTRLCKQVQHCLSLLRREETEEAQELAPPEVLESEENEAPVMQQSQ